MNEVPYTNDLDTLQTWIGRTVASEETLSVDACRRLQHTLGREATLVAGDVLPPLWHFISHLESAPGTRIGHDGHPMRGVFLPPVALPRRMWAGGRFRFVQALRLGDVVAKTSRVERVEMKSGRSGALCFVTVSHVLSVDGEVCIEEEQDLVYRDDPAPDAPAPQPKPAPTEFAFQETVTPSEVMLFRYSALTFNGHRIHYDREYARNEEGYPALVFHGPLTATLLADLVVSSTGRQLREFSFRGMEPLFDDAPFTVSGSVDGDEATVWAATPAGGLAMQASAVLAP